MLYNKCEVFIYLNLIILFFYVFGILRRRRRTIVGERDESDVFVSYYERGIRKVVHIYNSKWTWNPLYRWEKSVKHKKDKTIGLTRAVVIVQSWPRGKNKCPSWIFIQFWYLSSNIFNKYRIKHIKEHNNYLMNRQRSGTSYLGYLL